MITLHSHSIAQKIQTPTNRPGKILLRDLWWGYVDRTLHETYSMLFMLHSINA